MPRRARCPDQALASTALVGIVGRCPASGRTNHGTECRMVDHIALLDAVGLYADALLNSYDIG
ncbi:MAG TPA: hypothetical protein VJ978_12510, partial [Nitriliruptoraceae bacterium]|nr:hypothetical protein [Nitriliruptoraceae bacterium]